MLERFGPKEGNRGKRGCVSSADECVTMEALAERGK